MSDPAPSLRTWPGLVLLALLWFLHWLPALVTDPGMPLLMTGFFGPTVCAGGIFLWWIFGSRAPRRERWTAAGGLIVILVVGTALSHPTFRGMGTSFAALPWTATIVGLALVAARNLASPLRTRIVLGVAALAFGAWALVRIDGVYGDFEFELAWRWAGTPEEVLLGGLDERERDDATGGEVAPAEWPGFRGPQRDSVVPGIALAEDWSARPPRELWRIRVGPGWSSFAVAGDRLFTQEQRGDREVVVSYSAETGAELWVHSVDSRFWEALGGTGPRATPTLADGALYSLGAEGWLLRLDPATGEEVWRRDLREDAGRQPPMWGFSSSPLVVDGRVLVHGGGDGDRGLIAYEAATGELAWGAPSGTHGYASAQIAEVGGSRRVALVTDAGLSLYEPEDGAVVWTHDWPNENYRALQALFLESGAVLVSTPIGGGTRRLDLRRDGGELVAEERWTSRALKPDFNDLVAHEGSIYGLDPSILACADLETGERCWKGGRYGHGQLLLLPDADQLLVLAESGEIVLVRADPARHQELAKLEVLRAKTWNHPVLVGDRLYVRNAEEAVALEMPLAAG